MANDLYVLAVTVGALPVVDVLPDLGDTYLLAIAVAGSADFLVTGDKRDPLGLGRHAGTRIISASDSWTYMGSKSHPGARRL